MLYGDLSCAPPTILLWLLLCPWMWGIFFWVDFNIPLLMVVQQLVVILVFSKEQMSSYPSILPSGSPFKKKKGYMYTATAKSLQSCPTLRDPIDGSPPGSPVPGILQARTLEWVTISFSNA